MRRLVYSLCLLLAVLTPAHPQERLRKLDRLSNTVYENQPIQIVNREVGGRAVAADGTVMAGTDWLKQLTFTVKNVSDKTITAFDITVLVPQQGVMPNNYGMPFSFGMWQQILDAKGNPTGRYSPPPPPLKPGEAVTVRADGLQPYTLELLKKMDVTEIDKVWVEIQRVTFEDHTTWHWGKVIPESPRIASSEAVSNSRFLPSKTLPSIGRLIAKHAVDYRRQRRTVTQINRSGQPLIIELLSVGGRPVNPDGTVWAGAEWLRDFAIDIKNVSAKFVYSFEMEVLVPKQGSMVFDETVTFRFPTLREAMVGPDGKPTGEYAPLKQLAPGETVRLTLPSGERSRAEPLGIIDNIKTATLTVGRVVFTDKTKWPF